METIPMGHWKVKADTGNHQCQQSHFRGIEWWWGTRRKRHESQIKYPEAIYGRFWKIELWTCLGKPKGLHLSHHWEFQLAGTDECAGRETLLFLLPEISWMPMNKLGQLGTRDRHMEERTAENAFQEGPLFHPILWLYHGSPLSWGFQSLTL